MSDSAYLGSVTPGSRAEDTIEMVRMAYGRESTDKDCVLMGSVNVHSPFVWDGTMTSALRADGHDKRAAILVPSIRGGAMGPVTSAI